LQRGGISKPTAVRVFYCFILVITQIITNCWTCQGSRSLSRMISGSGTVYSNSFWNS
jgi:hypothetical protein